MGIITKAFVVDPRIKRRSEICHMASTADLVALPFDNVGELEQRWPDRGCFLVADEGSLIDQVLDASKRHGSYLPLIAYKDSPSIKDVSSALQAGSADYLQWPMQCSEIARSLSSINDNWENLVGAKNRKFAASKRLGELSSRELDVLHGMAKGLANKEIARNLSISPRTVEIHRSNMKLRLQVENSAQATQIAYDGLRHDATGLTREIQ